MGHDHQFKIWRYLVGINRNFKIAYQIGNYSFTEISELSTKCGFQQILKIFGPRPFQKIPGFVSHLLILVIFCLLFYSDSISLVIKLFNQTIFFVFFVYNIHNRWHRLSLNASIYFVFDLFNLCYVLLYLYNENC